MSSVPHRRFVVYEDLGDGAERPVLRASLYEKTDPRTGGPVVKARLEVPGAVRGWDGPGGGYYTLPGERLRPDGGDGDLGVLGKALCIGFLAGETRRRQNRAVAHWAPPVLKDRPDGD